MEWSLNANVALLQPIYSAQSAKLYYSYKEKSPIKKF